MEEVTADAEIVAAAESARLATDLARRDGRISSLEFRVKELQVRQKSDCPLYPPAAQGVRGLSMRRICFRPSAVKAACSSLLSTAWQRCRTLLFIDIWK